MGPLTNVTGRNKEISTNEVDIIAPNNSFMDAKAASVEFIPFWIFAVTD
mgnify:CR=1 FL=1